MRVSSLRSFVLEVLLLHSYQNLFHFLTSFRSASQTYCPPIPHGFWKLHPTYPLSSVLITCRSTSYYSILGRIMELNFGIKASKCVAPIANS
ncbi:hypothetical protein IC582_013914 [Cucumis melo]